MQFSALAAISFQNGRSSGRSSISARSPVSVATRQRRSIGSDGFVCVVSRRNAAPVARALEAMQAEIVPAALHVGRGESDAERFAQNRQVLEIDLFLKVLRAGGNQDALPAEDGGNEVGERLAGAGAGFREQDAAVVEDSATASAISRCACTRLEAGQRARERAVRRERLRRTSERSSSALLRVERELPAQRLDFRPHRSRAPRRRRATPARGR